MAVVTQEFRGDTEFDYVIDLDDVDVFDYVDATLILDNTVCPEIVEE